MESLTNKEPFDELYTHSYNKPMLILNLHRLISQTWPRAIYLDLTKLCFVERLLGWSSDHSLTEIARLTMHWNNLTVLVGWPGRRLTSKASGGSSYFWWILYFPWMLEGDFAEKEGALPVDCTLTIKSVQGLWKQ